MGTRYPHTPAGLTLLPRKSLGSFLMNHHPLSLYLVSGTRPILR